VARHADVWHAFGTPESLRSASERVDRLAEEAGRDPASITRAGSLSLSEPLDEVRRTADAWQEAGWGYLVCGWPGEGRERVEEFASAVLGT
jgi:alkanesulfonate monooxygenase SsuD/methylene tetrahydromethanopterin reductase-like flavin-dependent oxidoreductase (luciferase family)